VSVLCVRVPSYGLEIARRGIAAGEEAAALLVDKPDRGRVIELDERARSLGARIGQTALQASAEAVDARIYVRDAERSRRLASHAAAVSSLMRQPLSWKISSERSRGNPYVS